MSGDLRWFGSGAAFEVLASFGWLAFRRRWGVAGISSLEVAKRRFLVLCILVCFSVSGVVATAAPAVPALQVGSTSIAVDSMNLPIFVGDSSTPALVIRARKFYAEKKQKGFLRVGLWRVPVVEGFEMHFLNEKEIGPAIRKARQMVPALAEGSSAQFREVKFFFADDVTLVAERARWGRDMTWLFSGQIELQTGTNVARATDASLRMISPNRGEFTMNSVASQLRTNLFYIHNTSKK